MYLARHEFGKLTRVYEIRAVMNPQVFTFKPFLGEGKDKAPSQLCGPGLCAIGRTHSEALRMVHSNEELAIEELL